MVNSFEFKAKIKQGMIEISPEYKQNIQAESNVKVIIVSEETAQPRLMDRLAENPISVKGWSQPTRDEIHERK
ncbi:hypothetical protein [Roseofilum capinflatum]|uniref:Uncharacterized protein n=1 Tax=Roseofilum capinflatum BLCC-M114 TaxID=3022440 RepID=A0ABT7BCB4_9CYAN|nr:hypothetical protein [Roseofilum capinflatum]MDJ1176832.1 hypothetical protein [Roseofilum capinflatum BLCC-M114]